MIIAATQYGAVGDLDLPLYDYTGTPPIIKKDNNGNWELVFTGSCDITFRRLRTNVDLFLVGGGKNGAPGTGSVGAVGSGEAAGGNGGKGGKCISKYGQTLEIGKKYQVRPGAANSTTSAFGFTADTGSGTATGIGAVHGGTAMVRTAATAGQQGSLAWDTSNTLYQPGYRYGADGGGGGAYSTLGGTAAAAANGGAGGTNEAGNIERSGGDGGGITIGTGGKKGSDGKRGGGGGGGASYHWNTGTIDKNYAGGAGGAGIVMMRNAR